MSMPRLRQRSPPAALACRLREWSDMLARYDLEAVPPDVHLLYSMPGYYPTRVAEPIQPGELGRLGGRLMCYEYDKVMGANLETVLDIAQHALGIPLEQRKYTLNSVRAQRSNNERTMIGRDHVPRAPLPPS
jgi:hypothetical protein